MYNRSEYEKIRCERRRLFRCITSFESKKFCKECGKEFHSFKRAVVCSDKCARIRKSKRPTTNKKEYYLKNRSEILKRTKEKLAANPFLREIKLKKAKEHHRKKMLKKWENLVKSCRYCNRSFTPPNDRFEFCSHVCQRNAQRIKDRESRKTPEAREKRNAFLRKKNMENPSFRLRNLVSRTIWRALKKIKKSKHCSVVNALPYTIPQMKAHLESFFNNRNGFTWENHGTKWHIDHIIPQAMFPYSSMDSKMFRDCWALSNLIPACKHENHTKGARRVGAFVNQQGVFLA